ncbi:TonB-dependent receptor family protein [Algoriphagus vanfongensis]|uniref:TonB-dependent receptor family protein n=1 Tax=Algoriphagus vanfongensis TaxID=426371 RepID=UPI00047E5536|nr:TonB-dependent receptor plug domain-containing protein [Algoriphagus vanfongensis]
MKHKFIIILLCGMGMSFASRAQQDSVKTMDLKEVQIRNFRIQNPIDHLPNIQNLQLIGGRKSEVVSVRQLAANLSEKTGRTIFAKIPSAFVYDMDGSGNQINLSVRGLDGHRSWEFNVRQNGVMINTDIYGYPASHYSMPMEAVERIELVRGTASLQYGQQFGGMLNYVLKKPSNTQKISLENISTLGSFGLLSNFTSIGGTAGKWSYYAYYQKRSSHGYRDGAVSESDAQHAEISYTFSPTLKAKAELSRSTYLYSIPGQLTDEQFAEDPMQATRTRNYYSPEIYIPAISLQAKLGKNTDFSLVGSGVFGQRSSVTFDGLANVPDLIKPETNDYANRNVDIDNYHTRTVEGRILHHYTWGSIKNNLSFSSRYFNNSFDRRQRGQGTTGSDYDLSVEGDFPRDMNLKSQSIAFALENQFQFSDKFSLSPGIRIQRGSSEMTGTISYIEASQVPKEINYDFVTLGLNANYQIDVDNRIYAGFSQANRPVLFQDIIPGSPLNLISSDLEDSFGYNSEIGWENNPSETLHFNLTLFNTFYGNRSGNLLVEKDGTTYLQKSNIGDSRMSGLELLWDWEFYRGETFSLSFYTSSSWMNAEYVKGEISNGEENVSIVGNKVEAAPEWISRNGLNYSSGLLQLSLQHQFVGESFADALNTNIPPASGAVGMVPSYHVFDLQGIYHYRNLTFRASLLNLLDKSYFTKRPQMYPGPGIWPSDGRSLVFSIGFQI